MALIDTILYTTGFRLVILTRIKKLCRPDKAETYTCGRKTGGGNIIIVILLTVCDDSHFMVLLRHQLLAHGFR